MTDKEVPFFYCVGSMKIKKILCALVLCAIVANYSFASESIDDAYDYFDSGEDLDDQIEQEASNDAAGKEVAGAEGESTSATQDDERAQEPTVHTDGSFVIDRIEALVFGPEDVDIITLSDVERPSIDGAPRDIKLEKLMYQDAKKYRIIPDEGAIDKYLASVQKQHNLTLDQLKEVFRNAGYSYEEGREQFGVMYTVNSMLDFKIRSRLIVSERDVEAYCTAHPEYEEAAVQISRAFIPFTDKKEKDTLREKVQAFAVDGKSKKLSVTWEDPFWINENEVSSDKQFIKQLTPGSIAQPIETEDGLELIKLIAKRARREKSVQDRYREVADLLRKPKYDQLFAEYKKELLAQSAVVDF
jgi:hypothetical protein